MDFLKRFFQRKRPNPTKDWPIVEIPEPEINLDDIKLATLRFGDDFSRAQVLGRPDLFEGNEEAYCELIYTRVGFQVDFRAGRLAYIAFYIGPDQESESLKGLVYSKPHITGAGSLTSNVTEAKIVDWLGSPGDRDKTDEESVLFYPHREITMEFEFNAESCLKRWNLYPQRDAA